MTIPRKSSRREFLRGRAAADALVEFVDGMQASDERRVASGEEAGGVSAAAAEISVGSEVALPATTTLVHVTRSAMACEFEILLNQGQYPVGVEAAVEALDLVAALEGQLTVYREESEVCGINRRAFGEAVDVEASLCELLRRAQQISRETQGAFDITSGPLSKVWGFYRRQGMLPTDDALAAARACVGFDALIFGDGPPTVRFAKPGMEINLGGIGKGYALDRAAAVMESLGVRDFLFHGGQSSVLARGARVDARREGAAATSAKPQAAGALPTDDSPLNSWTLGLRHPLRAERRLLEIFLQDQAAGTSGTGVQHFHHRGRKYGHILDPRSGQPAEGLYSATAICPSAADADALATAFYVMGVAPTIAFCESHPEVGALLVAPGTREGSVIVHALNMANNGWRLLDETAQVQASGGV